MRDQQEQQADHSSLSFRERSSEDPPARRWSAAPALVTLNLPGCNVDRFGHRFGAGVRQKGGGYVRANHLV
jgi:hypothetical protein